MMLLGENIVLLRHLAASSRVSGRVFPAMLDRGPAVFTRFGDLDLEFYGRSPDLQMETVETTDFQTYAHDETCLILKARHLHLAAARAMRASKAGQNIRKRGKDGTAARGAGCH
jgi:hypothetical protein